MDSAGKARWNDWRSKNSTLGVAEEAEPGKEALQVTQCSILIFRRSFTFPH